MNEPLLSVRDLSTRLVSSPQPVEIVHNVSFDVEAGEAIGLVGESGCGKTVTMLSVMGLLPSSMEVSKGKVVFDGTNLLAAGEDHRRRVRGAQIAMIYQDPMTSLNPLMRIGEQISEALEAHGVGKDEAKRRTVAVLKEVGMPNPERATRAFPHEFSGGMRQRAMIAMALALHPKLLIADEPTTALDVTIQQQIIELVRRFQAEHQMAVVWITHDLGVVARIARDVHVMYAGHLVEKGPASRVFKSPEHPYTEALLASIPDPVGKNRHPLVQIRGGPPDAAERPGGCPFHPRCRYSVRRCETEMPPLTDRGQSRAACWVPPEEWTA